MTEHQSSHSSSTSTTGSWTSVESRSQLATAWWNRSAERTVSSQLGSDSSATPSVKSASSELRL